MGAIGTVQLDRYKQIMELRKNEPTLKMKDIAARLNCSVGTIHGTLEKARVKGWATPHTTALIGPPPTKTVRRTTTPTVVIPTEDLPDERMIALIGNPRMIIKALGL